MKQFKVTLNHLTKELNIKNWTICIGEGDLPAELQVRFSDRKEIFRMEVFTNKKMYRSYTTPIPEKKFHLETTFLKQKPQKYMLKRFQKFFNFIKINYHHAWKFKEAEWAVEKLY
jgi:hypothetical protein